MAAIAQFLKHFTTAPKIKGLNWAIAQNLKQKLKVSFVLILILILIYFLLSSQSLLFTCRPNVMKTFFIVIDSRE